MKVLLNEGAFNSFELLAQESVWVRDGGAVARSSKTVPVITMFTAKGGAFSFLFVGYMRM